MAETLDESAQRIAARGREALLDRLRPAFQEAAAAHADVLELDSEKLETMIQRAADRADGLQWRRALASVATEELGVGLGEALGHPAVERAQEIVGAPSYEQGLAAIAAGKPPDPGTGAPGGGALGGGATGPGATGGAATESEADGPVGEASAAAAPRPDAPEPGGAIQVRVGVVHLDGVPELDGEGAVELIFSADGLEVLRAWGGASLMRYAWSELHGVEVQPGRRPMLRRRPVHTRVIIGTTSGDARFEVEGADAEELERRLAPVVAKLGADG